MDRLGEWRTLIDGSLFFPPNEAQRHFGEAKGKILIRFTDVVQVWEEVLKTKAALNIQRVDGESFQVVFGLSETKNFVVFLYCHTPRVNGFVEVFCNWLKDTFHLASPLEKLLTHCIKVSIEAEMVRKERKRLTDERLQLTLDRLILDFEKHLLDQRKKEFEAQSTPKKRKVVIKKEKEEPE